MEPSDTGAGSPAGAGRVAAKPRMIFLDMVRTAAIVLVVVNHGLITFGVNAALGEELSYRIRLFTSAATPVFMLLFGVMLEVVAYQRVVKGQGGLTYRRLVKRSGMCYAGCLAILAAGVVQGGMSFQNVVDAALFFDTARFGNILKFYTIALTLAVPLLMFRHRFGVVATIFLGLSPWLVTPFMDSVPWPGVEDRAGYWTALVFGRPSSPNARYSVMHGLTLVVIGMGYGYLVGVGRKTGDWRWFRRCVFGFLGVALAAVVGLWGVGKLGDAYLGYVTWFRYEQHPGYYFFGTASVLLLVAGAYVLFPPGTGMARWVEVVTLIGRRTLLSYTLANVIFSLWPYGWTVPFWVGVAMTVLMLPLTHVLCAVWDRFERGRAAKRLAVAG